MVEGFYVKPLFSYCPAICLLMLACKSVSVLGLYCSCWRVISASRAERISSVHCTAPRLVSYFCLSGCTNSFAFIRPARKPLICKVSGSVKDSEELSPESKWLGLAGERTRRPAPHPTSPRSHAQTYHLRSPASQSTNTTQELV